MPVIRGKGKGKGRGEKKEKKERDSKEIGKDLLNVVEEMYRLKNIPKEVIFNGIEAALQMAAERASNGEMDVLVSIDRLTGEIVAQCGDKKMDPEMLGRIAAQSAKQVMIQKIREAESEGVYTDFQAKKGELVTGTVQRVDQGGSAIVTLTREGRTSGTIEAILPRSEQIPGETHHVNERVKAVVMDVRRNGNRVKIVLSRCHPDFVRALFEVEIPEIIDHTIEIKAVSREAGYRSKVAVTSLEPKVDCVGACVGVRGSRIKNIIDEINGERIDIVRWNDSMQVMIPNALQPAEISEVMIYHRLGRAIVLVTEDQLSLAIGRRGQNVRLASKLVGWDIEIMTHDELGEGVERAERWFSSLPHIEPGMIETMITEGFLSFTDLTFLEPAQLGEIIGVTEEQADEMIIYSEDMAEQIEKYGDPTAPAEDDDVPVVQNEDMPAIEGETPAETPETTETPAEEGGTLDDMFEDAPVEEETAPAEETGEPPAGLDSLFMPEGESETPPEDTPPPQE
jgi:transcription termination/antitermination protein NusA